MDGTPKNIKSITGKISGDIRAKAATMAEDAVEQLGKDVFKSSLSIEEVRGKLITLTRKNNTDAILLYSYIKDFAKQTPLSLNQTENGVFSLLQSGSKRNQIGSELHLLGDVSAGSHVDFNKIVELYAKAKTLGKLTDDDFDKLGANSGILLGALAEQFRTDEKGLRELINTGRVGFPQLEEAFKRSTSTGGLFYHSMDVENQNLSNKIQNLKDNYNIFTRDVGEKTSSISKWFVDGVTAILGGSNKTFSEAFKKEALKNLGASAYTDYYNQKDIVYTDVISPVPTYNPPSLTSDEEGFQKFSDSIYNKLQSAKSQQDLRDLIRSFSSTLKELNAQRAEGKISNKLFTNETAVVQHALSQIKFTPSAIKLNDTSSSTNTPTNTNSSASSPQIIIYGGIAPNMIIQSVDGSIPANDLKNKVGQVFLDLISDVNLRTK
jgi:hypothetical protein